MANKKSAPRYDLNAQNRKRDLAVRLGLTALVVLFAVGLVLYIVMGSDKKGGNTQAVRIASETVSGGSSALGMRMRCLSSGAPKLASSSASGTRCHSKESPPAAGGMSSGGSPRSVTK